MKKNNIEKFITLLLILSSIILITFIVFIFTNNDPPDNSSSSEIKFVIKDIPDNEDKFNWGPLRRK